MNKKAVAGLDFMKSFVIGLFVLIIILFALVIAAGNLTSTQTTSQITTIANETGYINSTTGNTTGYKVSNASIAGFTNFVVLAVWNTSDSVLIGSGNYSYNPSTGYIWNATSSLYNNVTINYNYAITSVSTAGHLSGYFISGISSLGASIPTWIVLAALVVLIAILSVVIMIVARINIKGKEGNQL